MPDWGIERLRVKLDSGAKTSAIHVSSSEQIGEHGPEGARLPVLKLIIPLSRVYPDRIAEVIAPVVGYKSVRDTGANAEHRAVVRTRLVCGPINRDIDVTVTDRSGMIFRMILGRQALEGVLIDSSLGYTLKHQARDPK